MRFFKRKEPPNPVPAEPQIRYGSHHPFHILDGYVPLSNGELQIYRQIRDAIPVVDAAIYKLIRLTGGVSATCSNPQTERQLQTFLRTVPVGRGQFGLEAFLSAYLDSLLTCGRAIGEVVPNAAGRDIAAILCGRPEDAEIREGDSPLDFTVCGRDSSGQFQPLPCQQLLLFTPFQPEAEHPYGVSLLRSLPFLSDILLKIYHTIGVNWERCGNLRYAVICKTEEDAQTRSQMLAREWSAAMKDNKGGAVRDFVAVGDVEIKVIGGDTPVLDSEVPVRQILEQIVAKTGLPPFMLGLSWNTTERMSSQQADILTTEITAIRRTVTPVLERICRLWMQFRGESGECSILWDDINLQDQVEEAKAALYREEARQLRIENDLAERTE